MKDKRIEQQIQHSLNAELSGLRTTSWQRGQFFENATGGTKVKRKLTYSLVLAVVLLLIAATALAVALLGGKDFVEEIMVPKAVETDSDSFTQDEIDEILRIAAENNLVLSEQDMYTLTHLEETGYFKEELMRRFVKTEYGFYPDAWPIEVQHWYEEMLEACGLDDGVICNVLPEGDEYTQEQILTIAQDFIHHKYDPNVNLDDPEKYLRFLTYRESRLGEGMTSRQWNLTYEARDLYGTDYNLTLDTTGHIKNEYSIDGIMGSGWEAHGQFMRDRFVRVYGDQYGFINWDSEILLHYQEAMKHRQTLVGPEHFLSEEYPILEMTYLLPDNTMMSRDAAIEKAREACGSLDYETLYSNSAIAVCMESADGKPVWKVTLRLHGGGYVFAQLNARTGEALITDTGRSDVYHEWRQYVTEEYWQEKNPARRAINAQPTAKPLAGWRLPAFWGDTGIAPAWYWEKLDAVGYNSEEAEEALYESWVSQYGYDPCFWPLEAQAIEILIQLGDEPDWKMLDFPGLPSDGDISTEEALRIAKAAFKEEYRESLPSLDVSVLKGAFSYWFDYMFESRNTWQVNLYRSDGVKIGSVWLESKLGEVFQLECFDGVPGLRIRDVSFNEPIATPEPLPDGKPWMWGMDFAPKEFWDKLEKAMDAFGVTAENYEQKEQEWYFEYGDIMFAPYECQVIASIMALYNVDQLQKEKPYYHTFPQEGKITRDQAIEIAVKALHDVGDPEVGAEYINDLKISAVLAVDGTVDGLYQTEDPVWGVFFDWDETYGCYNQHASAYITEDGEVILAQLELDGNG